MVNFNLLWEEDGSGILKEFLRYSKDIWFLQSELYDEILNQTASANELHHGKNSVWKSSWLKCGYLNKCILNATLFSCPFQFIRFGWVCCNHPKRMTGNGQLTRGAFRINDLLRNPYFNNAYDVNKIRPFIYKKWGF